MSKELLKYLVDKTVQEGLEKQAKPDIYLKSLASAGKEKRKLRVFDFDDTLVKTQSKVGVTKANGERLQLTPGEYAIYKKEPGDEMDYSHFQDLVQPQEIKWMTRVLRRVINKNGVNAAVILTARGSKKPVEMFFRLLGIAPIPIVALGDSDPQAKAQWVLYVIKKFNYDIVEFFDDSPKNVAAIEALGPLVPNTKIISRLIQHRTK